MATLDCQTNETSPNVTLTIRLIMQGKVSTVQYSIVQYSTVQYSIVQFSTVQYRVVQYSTVLCSLEQ